jgi:hypothetical protein
MCSEPSAAAGVASPAPPETTDLRRAYALLRGARLRWHLARHVHRNTRGQLLDFEKFRALVDIYRSPAPHIVVQSGVQSGKTEEEVVDTFAWAVLGLSVLYVLPKLDLRNTFVSNRINRLFHRVPAYAGLLAPGGAKTTGLKHLGAGAIRFVGSNAVTEFKEFPADVLVIDELDACDQGLIPYAYDRIAASPYAFIREVGNPTVPGVGIAARYQESTRRRWCLPCPACAAWVPLDWEATVVERREGTGDQGPTFTPRDKSWTPGCGRDLRPVCAECGGGLDRLGEGRWIGDPEHEEAEAEGFHLSRLLSPYCRLSDLWAEFQMAQTDELLMQRFYNSQLGLPYVPLGGRVTPQTVAACIDPGRSMAIASAGSVLGVDVGTTIDWECSTWQGERKIVLAAGRAKEFEELDQVMAAMNVSAAVIDALPEQRKATEFAARHPRRVWLAFYAGSGQTRGVHWLVRWDEPNWAVTINRTPAIGMMLARYSRRLASLPRNLPPEYAKHIAALVRVAGRDATGNPTARYVSTGPDHFGHAAVYSEIARLRGQVGAFSVERWYEPPPGHEGEIYL